VVTAPEDLETVRKALVDAGVELESAELAMQPKSTVDVPEDQVAQLMRLMDALEEHDDVNAVHANFNVDADVLERVAG
jgi:transcriptional/translational regulatory protein YebC/TACO1